MQKMEKEMRIIQDFLDLLDKSEVQNPKLISLVDECDNEQQDMLHELELETFYRTEGHRKARKLQKLRQVRRAAKDTIGLWMPIKEFSKQHKKMKCELKSVIEDIKHTRYLQENRQYAPRSKTKACKIAGKHFDSKPVDIEEKLLEFEQAKAKEKAK